MELCFGRREIMDMVINYEFCDKAYNDNKCVWINENNEAIVISKETDNVYRTEVAQLNNWLRVNYYHKDGTVEETFER